MLRNRTKNLLNILTSNYIFLDLRISHSNKEMYSLRTVQLVQLHPEIRPDNHVSEGLTCLAPAEGIGASYTPEAQLHLLPDMVFCSLC